MAEAPYVYLEAAALASLALCNVQLGDLRDRSGLGRRIPATGVWSSLSCPPGPGLRDDKGSSPVFCLQRDPLSLDVSYLAVSLDIGAQPSGSNSLLACHLTHSDPSSF